MKNYLSTKPEQIKRQFIKELSVYLWHFSNESRLPPQCVTGIYMLKYGVCQI